MRKHMTLVAVATIASAAMVAACGSSVSFPAGDTGTDTGGDWAGDTGGDTHGDTGGDPGSDTGTDWIVEDPPFEVQCPLSQIPTEQVIPLDVLVVVDDSRSMSEEQANLAENFPNLIREMLSPPIDPVTGRPDHFPVTDLHIGVVSTDMGTGGYTVETCPDPIDGDDGILQHAPNPALAGCAPAYPTYLSYDDDTAVEGDIERLATGFGCIATLGSGGCGFEQHFKAAARALENAALGGPNAGFLREGSVLAIVFVSDEEDCSVSDPAIFNTADPSLGHLNLRCYLHAEMVHAVETYLDAYLATHPIERLYVGAIVGVPADSSCEGAGDEIGGCLDHPMMNEEIDPVDPTRLRYVCSTATGNAMPARRFVTLAQDLGQHSMVGSICTDDFSPFVGELTGRLQSGIDESSWHPPDLQLIPRPGDPCHCDATCLMIEMMQDAMPCPLDRECYEADGPGTGCTRAEVDGVMRSLCVIPQAGSRLKGCVSSEPDDCESPGAVHVADGEGWYYVPTGEAGAQIAWNGDIRPTPGADLFIACCP